MIVMVERDSTAKRLPLALRSYPPSPSFVALTKHLLCASNDTLCEGYDGSGSQKL